MCHKILAASNRKVMGMNLTDAKPLVEPAMHVATTCKTLVNHFIQTVTCSTGKHKKEKEKEIGSPH